MKSKLAILLTLLVLLVINSPFLYFNVSPKAELTFLGRLPVNSQDFYTYLSFIEQGKQGHTLLANLYTSEQPVSYSLLRPSYLVIGRAAAVLNLSSLSAYFYARLALSLLFCLTLYIFLSRLFPDHHLLSYTIVLTSSGVGWALSHFLPNSTDLWIPEGNTFLSLFEAPHFILSQTLLLSGYLFFLRYLRTHRPLTLLGFAMSFLLLALEHPFNLFVAIPVIFLTALYSGTGAWTAILLSGISGFGLLYQLFETLRNPILSVWQTQNLLASPTPINFLSGYGLLIPLAIFGTSRLNLGKLSPALRLLLSWIALTCLLLYAPLSFQRRLVEGVHIPLAVLATLGLTSLLSLFNREKTRVLTALSILILSFSSVFMLIYTFRNINADSTANYTYHVSPAEQTAILWLGGRSAETDVILANSYFGNLIPGLIARPVYLGHAIQTTNYSDKIKLVDTFLASRNPPEQKLFLTSNQLKFIFFGRLDPMLTNFDPNSLDILTSIYDQDGVRIYRVN